MDDLGYSIPEFISQMEDIKPDPPPTEQPGIEGLRIDTFFKTINSFSSLNEQERFAFLKCNIDLLAYHVNERTCRYLRRLVEPALLNTLEEVFKVMPMTYPRRLMINYLAYNYQFAKTGNKDTLQKLLDISAIANAETVANLISIGLDKDTAVYMAVCRHSDQDEIVNVVRVNNAIYPKDSYQMDVQKIVYIYEKLFDQMRYLFIGTMMENKESVEVPVGYNEDDYFEVFGTVSLALLTILDNMTLSDIDTVIRIFLDSWKGYGQPKTRFSLRALSMDFSRVRATVEHLHDDLGIWVP